MHQQAPGQCPTTALRGPSLSLPLESIIYPSSAGIHWVFPASTREGSKLMHVRGADPLRVFRPQPGFQALGCPASAAMTPVSSR